MRRDSVRQNCNISLQCTYPHMFPLARFGVIRNVKSPGIHMAPRAVELRRVSEVVIGPGVVVVAVVGLSVVVAANGLKLGKISIVPI